MAPAHLSTNQRDRAGLFPRASRGVASSRHDHQKGHLRSALSRARGHGVVRVNHESKAAPSSRSVELHVFLKTCRGLRGSGLSHSHRHVVSLPHCRLVAERAFPAALAITNSLRVVACKRLPAKACQHEPLVNRTSPAGRIHHQCLSSSPSSAGFKTSWKDLTCEAEPLSSDDKIHD